MAHLSGAGAPDSASIRGRFAQVLLVGILGGAGPLLASCGSSGAGLIPAQNAGPLQSDFDAVAEAAERGNGSCAATEEAILKTEQDFTTLPVTVDAGLRGRLHEGITKLHADALELCKQSLSVTTATSTSTRTSPATTTPHTTPTSPTVTQPTTTPAQTTPTTTPPTSGSGGGTPAPGATGGEGSPGAGSEQGAGAGPGVGGAGDGGQGAGAGGQEGSK